MDTKGKPMKLLIATICISGAGQERLVNEHGFSPTEDPIVFSKESLTTFPDANLYAETLRAIDGTRGVIITPVNP
jgi:hypothetical protein